MLKLLFAPDPAFLRLKMATRTIIAVIIAAAISIPLGKLSMITACLGALFLSIAIFGYSTKEKLKAAAIGGASIVAGYAIGIVCKQYFWISSPVLIIAAFLAFYVRRFGPKFAMFPIFSWMMIFIAIIFPLTQSQMWLSLSGVAISVLVAAIINVTILPEKRLSLFLDNFASHLHLNHSVLTWLNKHLLKHEGRKSFRAYLMPRREKAGQLMLDNQIISSELFTRNHCTSNLSHEMLLWQYDLSKAVGILIDSLCIIFYENKEKIIGQNFLPIIRQSIRGLSQITNEIKVEKKHFLVHFPKNVTDIDTLLEAFQQELCQFKLGEKPELIYFYNCYTSLERYWITLKQLREFNATSN